MLCMALDGAMVPPEVNGGLLVDGLTDTDPIGDGADAGGMVLALVLGALIPKGICAAAYGY
jgi:hypothetical protein